MIQKGGYVPPFTRSIFLMAFGVILLLLAGCSSQAAPQPAISPTQQSPAAPTEAPTPDPTAADTPLPSATTTDTPVPTATFTPTISLTPTITNTPTISPTPTRDFPDVTVSENQAFCRYGPGTAYLYSHGLYAGEHAVVHGRNYSGTWLWIQPDNLDRHCWAAASVFTIEGDVSSVPVVQTELPKSTLYGPPEDVEATRSGNQVTVSWEAVWMTEDDDRGYLIEATICQNGVLIPIALQTDSTSYTFTDDQNCSGESRGRLYTVEKHGYTTPVEIPWP